MGTLTMKMRMRRMRQAEDEDDFEEDEARPNNLPKHVSVSLDAVDEFEEGQENANYDENGNGDGDGDRDDKDTYDRYARGQTFVSMELQLIAMNEKIAALVNEVHALKKRNHDLENDKVRLIKNTSCAMNECRKTIQTLCIQNNK